jgi:uncharacterized protein (UPF0335 family)
MNATTSMAAGKLRDIIERIERLEEARAGLADDIKAIVAEAKADGYDPGALKKVLQERAMDADKRRDLLSAMRTYRAALGMDE